MAERVKSKPDMSPALPIIPKNHETPKPPCKNACAGCTGNGGCGSGADDHEHSSVLAAEEQVLPTLRRDGSRNWICPSLSQGYYWHRRRALAYGLIAFFVTLPHLRIAGKPYVLMDIAKREFTFFGHTFYPTDTPLLACLMLMAF